MNTQTPVTINPLSPDQIKQKEEFGKKAMADIFARWVAGWAGETLVSRIARFKENREYMTGKQNTDKFKKLMTNDSDIIVVNIDYRPLTIAVPYVNRVIDRYTEREESIKCIAIDPLSVENKRKAKDNARWKMEHGDHVKALQDASGMQLEEFSENDPKNEDELDILFDFKYKQREEILMELGVRLIDEKNSWNDVIKPRLIFDEICCGFGVVYSELDGNNKIKDVIVKPENFISSYCESDDFSDWQHQGQMRYMSISELRLRFPNKMNEEDLFKMAQTSSGQFGNPEFAYGWNDSYNSVFVSKPWDRFVIRIVDVHYKTLNNLVYDVDEYKNGWDRLTLKKDGVSEGKKETSPPYYVAYHGMYNPDSKVLFQWEIAKNMLKDNSDIVEIKSPYSVYMYNNVNGHNTPLAESMKPIIDLIHEIHYKTLILIANIAPDGADIDVSALAEMDLGLGRNLSPMDLYSIVLQTGQRFYKGKTDEGGDSRPPITPTTFQGSNKLEQLQSQWETAFQRLQIITGTNNLDSGIITNQGTASVTVDSARQISASATNFLYAAYLKIRKENAKKKQIMLWDQIVLGDSENNPYAKALGIENVQYIKQNGDDFDKANFDVIVEAVIDEGEMQRTNERINIALANKEITIQDTVDLDFIENPRYKSMLLAARARRKEENDMRKSAFDSEQNMKQNVVAAQETGKQAMQLEQQRHANKMQEMDKQLQAQEVAENFKFAGIIKSKVVDGILAKPGATWQEIPGFVWDTLHLTDQTQKQVLFAALQEQAAQNAQQQAMMQQQAMGQQQNITPQQQMQPPVQEDSQEQVA